MTRVEPTLKIKSVSGVQHVFVLDSDMKPTYIQLFIFFPNYYQFKCVSQCRVWCLYQCYYYNKLCNLRFK